METELVKLQNLLSTKIIKYIEINATPNDNGEIVQAFNERIDLPRELDFFVSLLKFQASSFFPNINESFKNNKFYYSIPNNAEMKDYTFLDGAYEFEDIAKTIKDIFKEKESPIGITLDKATGRIKIYLENGYKIYFNQENTIRDILGFESFGLDKNLNISTKMGNVVQTNIIYVDLDVIEGSILKGNKSSILYSFPKVWIWRIDLYHTK